MLYSLYPVYIISIHMHKSSPFLLLARNLLLFVGLFMIESLTDIETPLLLPAWSLGSCELNMSVLPSR